MSKIMILPGTKWQIPLIRKIKSKGHQVYIVNPEDYMDLCGPIDGYLKTDIYSVDDIEEYAVRAGIEAVISDQCDIAVPVVAELGRRLGLPAVSCETAALYTNKYLMRMFCEEHGLKHPEYKLCRSKEDVIGFFRALGKPIVIKPLDSNASKGVFTVNSEDEVYEHFSETVSYSRSEKAIIAERYIHGTEFTVDGVKTPDAHYTLAISEKKHYNYNENIANELLFSHTNDTYDYDKLKESNDLFVMRSPLQFGLTHAEYKYEDGHFYLIEIGARGGGNMIASTIAPFMSGHDTYEYLIACALGNIRSVSFDTKDSCMDRAAVLKFFDVPDGGGRVKDVAGIEHLEADNDIVDHALYFSRGSMIKDADNDSSRIGYYIACSESRERLRRTMRDVEEHFKIIME